MGVARIPNCSPRQYRSRAMAVSVSVALVNPRSGTTYLICIPLWPQNYGYRSGLEPPRAGQHLMSHIAGLASRAVVDGEILDGGSFQYAGELG